MNQKVSRTFWHEFFDDHQVLLEKNYPGLTLERFLREAGEIGGDGEAFLKGIPFAYLLGYAEFYGHKFKVTPDVLIPRPETERLTELAIEWIKNQNRPLKIVDVCTGSGCIGLTIAHQFSDSQVFLSDISVQALIVAGDNADAIAPQANIIQSDLLEEVRGKFDLIVSNPPYIPASEKNKTVHAQVDQYEPAIALYVIDDEYQEFFCRLFAQVRMRLNPGGLFIMEGQPEKLDECAQWAHDTGFSDVSIQKDWADRSRFLRFNQP